MRNIKHEQVLKGRTLSSRGILKKELDRAILMAAAVLAPVNAVFVMLAYFSDPSAVFDAMIMPVCSVLIITALVFLKNAVVNYFDAVSVKNSAHEEIEREDIPESTVMTA